MKKTLHRALALGALLAATSTSALAVPIWVGDSRPITEDGQTFEFLFTDLAPSDGSGGQFSFFAKGDFTGRSERATVTLDLLGGRLTVNEDRIFENSIAGLSLVRNDSIRNNARDTTLDFLFALDGRSFDAILQDGRIGVTVSNTANVDEWLHRYPDQRVAVGFDYQAVETGTVPEPGSLALLGMGGLMAGAVRRRRARGCSETSQSRQDQE